MNKKLPEFENKKQIENKTETGIEAKTLTNGEKLKISRGKLFKSLGGWNEFFKSILKMKKILVTNALPEEQMYVDKLNKYEKQYFKSESSPLFGIAGATPGWWDKLAVVLSDTKEIFKKLSNKYEEAQKLLPYFDELQITLPNSPPKQLTKEAKPEQDKQWNSMNYFTNMKNKEGKSQGVKVPITKPIKESFKNKVKSYL